MRGLLIRLAETDSDAAAALKIIGYFDALSEQSGLDFSGLALATSALADCPVVIQLASNERFRSDGTSASDPAVVSDQVSTSSLGHAVWLERSGPAEPADPLILEQCAQAVDVIADRRQRRVDANALQEPHLVDDLLDRTASEQRHRSAAERLGLRHGRSVRVIAVDVDDTSDRAASALALVARVRDSVRPVNVTARGGVGIALVEESADAELAADIRGTLQVRYGQSDSRVRCGISSAVSAEEIADAWEEALAALRFSIYGLPEQAVTTFESLGAVSLLVEVPVRRLKVHSDVIAIERIRQSSSGEADLKVLDVFCNTGSLRSAAQSLHLHHSSVAARLAQIEQLLGWALDTAEGRSRSRTAILADRLAYER